MRPASAPGRDRVRCGSLNTTTEAPCRNAWATCQWRSIGRHITGARRAALEDADMDAARDTEDEE